MLARRAIRFATYCALAVGSGLALIVPAVATAVFGRSFRDIVTPTLILLPGYVCWSSVYITTVYVMGSLHRPLINLWIALLATVIDIPLAYFLGTRYGAVGAALASTASYGTAAAVNCVTFLRLSGSSLRSVVAAVGEDVRFVRSLVKTRLLG